MKLPLLIVSCLTVTSMLVKGQDGGRRRGPQADQEQPLVIPSVPLTPQQIELISKQLAELDTQITDLRGNTLATVMAKLRTAAASDAAAMNFYLDCEKLVSVERKDLTKTEERERKEQMDRRSDKKDDDKEGDMGLATRLHVVYLLLSLEAHETKAEDRAKLIPKLQTYIQEVLANAVKLKGRAGGRLNQDVVGSPIVDAYQIRRYLGGDGWTTDALDLGGMWEQTILPYYKEAKPESLAEQWDARINAMGIIRKERMSEAEFQIWTQQELPALKWTRATYLLQNGPTPVNAVKDMLDIIKAYPGHANAKSWLEVMRGIVKPAESSAQ